LGLTLEIDENFHWIEQDWNKWDNDWLIFLTHSDFDGYFTAYRCGRIAKKLKLVFSKWYPEDIYHIYDLEHGLKLVDAMEYCNKNNEILILC